MKGRVINYRSRDRIIEFGEVFTPEAYVEDLINEVGSKNNIAWSDENTIFFEPTCGHGNIVVAIVKKRLRELYKKCIKVGVRNPSLYAIANTINTLWAIDIDENNINDCRQRVLTELLVFISENGVTVNLSYIKKNYAFFTHLVCALKWHIHQNECLTSLSSDDEVSFSASKTKTGYTWFKNNGHHPLDFELSWCQFFRECESNNLAPLEYERGKKFISALLNGKIRGYLDFEFAKILNIENYYKLSAEMVGGA